MSISGRDFENLKASAEFNARTVANRWLLERVRPRFPYQETGPAVSWALPISRQRVYTNHSRKFCLDDPPDIAGFHAAVERELNSIFDSLVQEQLNIAAAGGTEIVLVWRLKDFVQFGLEKDHSRYGSPYVFGMRARCAFTTLQERIVEQRMADGELNTRGAPLDPPRARLYTEEQILEIRTMESRATAIGTHGEYTRIPLTGLYVKTNCWLLRQFRRLKSL